MKNHVHILTECFDVCDNQELFDARKMDTSTFFIQEKFPKTLKILLQSIMTSKKV